MRHKVACVVHQVDRSLPVLDPDVHMQAKDQVGTRHQLHIFDDVLVTIVGSDFLHSPVRKRMGCSRGQAKAVVASQFNHVPAQSLDLGFRLFDVGAN